MRNTLVRFNLTNVCIISSERSHLWAVLKLSGNDRDS